MKRILVLIVEDEDAIARALKDWMVQANVGYEVVVVQDGREALDRITAERFDIVLLDLVMPRMDGWQFISALKEKNINTKVIILTNLDSDEDKARARDLGVTDYFVKNDTTLAMLEERIKKVIGAS